MPQPTFPRVSAQSLLLTLAALATLALLARNYVFLTVRVELAADRETVFDTDRRPLEITARNINRLGIRVPFTAPRLRFEVMEGADLATVSAGADSGSVLVQPTGAAGSVQLRILVSGYPLPFLFTVAIVAPVAARTAGDRAPQDGLPGDSVRRRSCSPASNAAAAARPSTVFSTRNA
jgi:hypothetical protein